MKCQQIDKYMYEFCDSRLSPQMQDSIQSHLDQCQNCREKVTAASQEGILLRGLDSIPVLSPEFTHQVLARVQQKHGEVTAGVLATHAHRYPRPFRWWWGVASAAVLLLALCSMPLQELQSPTESKLAGQNSAGSAPVETAPLALDGIQTTQGSSAQPPQETFILESKGSPKTIHKDSSVVVKGMGALPQELPHPAPAARPYTSIALSDQTLKSATHNNPNRGAELLTLHPANLPPEYTLRAIISTSDQDTTFVYLNQFTQQELNVRITVVAEIENANQANVEQPLMRSAAPPRNDGLGGSTLPEGGVPDNTFKAMVDHNQNSYEMVLSGSLKVEELAAIANSIKFEEGNQGVKTEIP